MFQGSPLESAEVLREDASLVVIRRTLPEAAANCLQEARREVANMPPGRLQEVRDKMPGVPALDVLSAVLLACALG